MQYYENVKCFDLFVVSSQNPVQPEALFVLRLAWNAAVQSGACIRELNCWLLQLYRFARKL